ncbi:hypothetical protein BXZ70DRAFT_889154 [Cristinia sonorae]|uniref:Uncharacterized protein n=1 Tax=Cristinia sonorae TaxID=1940300 RepID=A0A8K0UTH9_9AGAR|nr:hypothetical protein BXZ70DRAFT_889154 [Cristinia sonorae]
MSPPSSPTLSAPSSTVYKGKVLRSWAQLPPEVIQLIATFHMLQLSQTSYIPNTWDIRDNWPRRMVYTIVRDAIAMESLMCVCPSWGAALEHHLYWQHALAVLDPHDLFAPQRMIVPQAPTAGSNTFAAPRPTPYRLCRNVLSNSCVVCRINYPYQNNGLGIAKRMVPSLHFGPIALCREHFSRKDAYCGLCLREGPPMEIDAEYAMVCCYQNEDEDTWPGITTTCRNCRMEGLWTRVADRPADREAIGGPKYRSSDWETRQSVEAFLDVGEGTIMDVVTLAREKYWLRRHTKLSDMLQQALAAARFVARTEAGENGYGSDDDMSDEDDEDDAEFMSATEDQGGVKDIAVMDWARNRILDGFWISPADQWYNHVVPGHSWHVPAQHPCPWHRDALYSGALEDGEGENGSTGEELEHPRPKTVKGEVPPSFHLCDQTYRAFQKSMRDVLFPAMSNLVRRIVIECTADGTDPTIRASRMSMEEVVQELRDEAVWFNGIDWLERRANRAREERDRIRGQAPRITEEDDSSSSSRSDGSHTTSPVLSTTTLQTTPSPPPSGDPSSSPKEEDLAASSPVAPASIQLPIPISPVLKSPQLIHPIPYIPVTTAHLPYYSMESLKHAWREACAPLYHCRCSICERAILKANIASGTVVPSQAPQTNVQQPAPPPAQERPAENKPLTIHIQKPSARRSAPVGEEEEEEEDDSILDSDDDYVEEDEEEVPLTWKGPGSQKQRNVPVLQPGQTVYPVTPRKRPSQELELDDNAPGRDVDGDVFMDGSNHDTVRRANNGTPPKRARVDEGKTAHPPTPTPPTRTMSASDTKRAKMLPLPRTPGVVRVSAGGQGGKN